MTLEIGIVVNPASGKDIRRIAARASVFDNQEKSAMIRRCVAAIEEFCPDACIRYYPDSYRMTESVLADSKLQSCPIDMTCTNSALDSSVAADHLLEAAVVVSLGGDGTNRAIAKTLHEAIPLIALSTGTNNAFPTLCEATSAGMAAAFLAMGEVVVEEVAPRTKAIHVKFENGDFDLALIDIVGVKNRFTGTRALLDANDFVYAVMSVADPSKVGVSAIGGCAHIVADEDDYGMALGFIGEHQAAIKQEVRTAVAPGLVKTVEFVSATRMPFNDPFVFSKAAVLAFDGERERYLEPGESLTIHIARDGPRRVNVPRCLRLASTLNLLDWNDEMDASRDAV